jgi:hypothetical protein
MTAAAPSAVSASAAVPDLVAIDGLLRELQALIDQAINQGSRLGYFGCLYARVTAALRRAIVSGAFADPVAVARLDVAFARRYLDAVAQHNSGAPSVPRPWMVALDACARADLSVVQHLALAINAHVNFDLSVATFECFGAANLQAAHADFDKVNDILESVLDEVEGEIARVSPLLRAVRMLSGSVTERLIGFGLVRARAYAWRFAEILAVTPPALRPTLIAEKAREVAFICEAITEDHLRNALFAAVVALEVKDVRRVIRAMYRGLTF